MRRRSRGPLLLVPVVLAVVAVAFVVLTALG
jgi:hypothetical protein